MDSHDPVNESHPHPFSNLVLVDEGVVQKGQLLILQEKIFTDLWKVVVDMLAVYDDSPKDILSKALPIR